MGVRKNAVHLTATERDNFLRAVLTLKNTIANPAAPVAQQISIYDQFAAIHLYTLSINVPGGGLPINMGHGNSGFGPWHRYYLRRFEQALQAVDPTVTLPYWDWTDHTATETILLQDNYLGPNGGPGGVGGGTIQSGYFAFNAPGAGGNPTPLPPWWPVGLAGWRIRASLEQGNGTTLRRFRGNFANLTLQANVQNTMVRPDYENDGTPANSFRRGLEAAPRMHNSMHTWVNGHMGDPLASPNDLIFFLHHCNIDRLWAMWQIDGHRGAAFYPAAGRPQGHNLNDPMWPWVGGLAGYSSNNAQPDIVIPDFTGEPIQRPADMLNHRALGFSYDTEAIVGVALDQTGSMLGMTPDPMTGMPPNISKWNAAKQGVSFFLHDCEVAHDAIEAYIVAGVETFRSLPANTFTQVFGATPFGVVKNGGPHSQAGFDANIAGFTPNGGTPLAGALTDTNTSLVRAPFSDLPAGEQRYLCILTDGKETALPLLTSLGTPQFPNTVIFAMGFGVGGGWDGVDYATITDMTTKGKAAPSGVAQVFHGENAGEIDKFYTNSVAAAIGYTPAADPVYELFPGEYVHFHFSVTDADRSLMITALGFDFSDKNWEFCLMAPDGWHCCDTRGGHSTEHPTGHNHGHSAAHGGPFLVTMKKRNGRCTIFLHRNGAEASAWAGSWALMAMYKADEDGGVMVMPGTSGFVLPVGAPPVRGPLYTRFEQQPSQRPVARALAGIPPHRLAAVLPGSSMVAKGPACSVAINVFTKTTLQSNLTTKLRAANAGEDFELTLRLADLAPGRFNEIQIAARLVAPKHTLGNAFADIETISLPARRKYLNKRNPRAPFDELAYLADYERKKPGAFPMRDEEVVFRKQRDGTFRAKVTGNVHPGIHRVALYLTGTYDRGEHGTHSDCCATGPQAFSRVLHAEVALGILPEAEKSKPRLHWIAPDKFIVAVTPTDKLGNIAAPGNAAAPVVTINGKRIRGRHVNPYTGEQQIEITINGKGLAVAADGQSITGATAMVETEFGSDIALPLGKKLQFTVEVGPSSFAVVSPRFVGDRRSRTAWEAGAREAMRIPLEHREIFATEIKTKQAGYKLELSRRNRL